MSAARAGRDLLRMVPIFSHLPDDELDGLARLVDPRAVSADALVVGQEDRGDALYVLARGRVKVVIYGESGREVILHVFRRPGDFFGEMSLLDGRPRSASVIAAEDSELLVLSREAFREHLRRSAGTALAVLAEMSRRLREADEVIGNLALLDVYGRLARKLRDIADADGEPGPEGVVIRDMPTQSDIAAMIGTSRETVSRAFAELARRGAVRLSGRRLVLRPELIAGAARER
ncbi:MAG TPA: Crp/Fnr family transcriptional regulator [Anaeromyxobacteraceae bacterium]|jgi:CRP-like cAMP-binding protein